MRLTSRHLAAAAVLIAASSSCSDSTEPTSPHGASLNVALSVDADTILESTTRTITARVTDQLGALRLVPVTWQSTDPSVASVSGGKITGVSAGMAMIIASAGASADSASFTVIPQENTLDIQPSAATVALGDSIEFFATIRTRSGDVVAVNQLSWSSSDTAAARFVSGGKLVATAEGDLSISAEAAYRRGSGTVRVFKSPVSSVTITPGTANVYRGATLELDVTLRDQQGRLVEGNVTFGSSDYSKATINQDGIVTGVNAGSVVITATSGTKTGSASITVLGTPASSVTITLPSDTVPVGVEVQATATPLDASGAPITGRTIAYQSANPSVATITSTGKVKGIVDGSTTISAIVDGKVGSKRIYVGGRRATSISVSPGSPSVSIGQQSQLTARVLDQMGTEMIGQPIIWNSSNQAVALVSPGGLVTALNAGSASISASAGVSASVSDAGLSASAVVGGLSSTVVVTVAAAPVASVQVSPTTVSVVIGGGPAALTASAFDAGGNLLAGRVATWSSQNPTVASVNSSGVVSAIGAGSTTITANIEGKTANVTVTVGNAPPAPVSSVTVTLGTATLSVGQQTQASAILKDAQGNTLSRPITWTSVDTAVAKVSASGLVTSHAGGTVAIIANSEGVLGSAALTVSTPAPTAVAVVTLTVPTQNLNVGQSVQSVVTLKDVAGNILTGRTISYSTVNPAIVTVQASGVITAVGAGTTNVRATSEGKTATVAMTVTAAAPVVPVVSVSLTASGTSLAIGQTMPVTATPLDGHGVVLTGRTITWSSTATNVATVSTSGVVNGVAAGSSTIRATVDGVVGSLAISVQTTVTTPPPPPPPTSPPPGGNIATLAELPRSVPEPTFAKATRVVQVSSNLQAALDAAQPGDSLVLSGTFTGNFILPTKPCGAGITITSAATLPPAGTRVTPTSAALFAKIITPNASAALRTQNPTCGWRIVGVEIAASASAGVIGTSMNYGIFWLGDGGWLGGGENQRSLAMVPQQILIDRIYLHGATTTNSMRCLFLNSGNTVIRDSWISDCHAAGFDSQAILGCNGPGPYLIENNDLQGATENILFGGCDPVSSDLIPSDITIRRNYIHKPEAWKGTWAIKNLFELKNARRVLLEGNVLENSWQAGQAGMAIVLKSSTETCAACTWEGTKDVTVRYNVFRYAHRGLNIQAIDASSAGTTASHTERVTVEHNLFTDIGLSNGIAPSDGWLMLLTHDLKDILIQHNTFVSNTPGYGFASYFSYSGGAAQRIEILNNVYAGQSYYALAADGGNHAAALTTFAGSSWRFVGNAVSQIDQQFWSLNPSGNNYTDRVSSLGLASDGSLSSGSPYKNRATDSTDPGANVALVMQKTQGVKVAP